MDNAKARRKSCRVGFYTLAAIALLLITARKPSYLEETIKKVFQRNINREGFFMKRFFCIFIAALFLSACGQTPEQVVVTSQITILVTVEITHLVTQEVTRMVVVTANYSSPTETPAPSPTPKPTEDQTKTDMRDGSYMVGTEISPGIWRSSG